MATNFSERLRAFPDYLAYQQAMPQNTTTVGNRGGVLVGNVQGRLEIVAEIQSDIDLTDTFVFTINLEGAATETGSYTQFKQLYTITAAAGSGVITAGTKLASYVVDPEVDPLWVRASLVSTDVDVAGAVDVYVRMIA